MVTVLRCPDCRAITLIIRDPTDPRLPDELATKVDRHQCVNPPTQGVE